MNERFKTLWFEAAESKGGDSWEEQTAFMERFAELIVLECAGVTLDYKNDAYYTGWCDHAEEILRHFGVEE